MEYKWKGNRNANILIVEEVDSVYTFLYHSLLKLYEAKGQANLIPNVHKTIYCNTEMNALTIVTTNYIYLDRTECRRLCVTLR